LKPRPLYKWKSFWLGILVLGFLGWAWIRSRSHYERVGWSLNLERRYEVSSCWSKLSFDSITYNPSYEPGFYYEREDIDGRRWFPPAVAVTQKNWLGSVSVAHWIIILHFLAVWSTWLFFHWKRERKKSASS